MNNTSLQRDSFPLPPISTCIMADSKMTQLDTGVCSSENMNRGKGQNKMFNVCESDDVGHDIQEGGGGPSSDVADIMASGIRTHQRKKRVKKYCGENGEFSNFLVNNLESMEGDGSSVLVVEKGKRSTFLDLSEEACTSGCLDNMSETEVVAGHGTSSKDLEDILTDKAPEVCLDLEHANGESGNRHEVEHSVQAIRAKPTLTQNVVHNVYSSDESVRFNKGKESGDVSDWDPPSEHLDNKRKLRMEVANASLAQLDEMKHDAVLVTEKDDHPPQMLQSSQERSLTACFRRKLLILDVNGVLADIVSYVPEIYEADTIIGMKAVFKRPFCDDFLQFCFERFHVGVWSSRTKRNVELVLDFLMGKTRGNLLFCWDQSHCTDTGFNTVENRDKPLILKELKKLWEKHDPHLPWERGDYNESNTLLLDDSPYKALRNPPNTAIFPFTYQYKNQKDNSLGPGGDLRIYLEGLALAENVQKYVEQNPFGQRPITKTNLSWRYYLKVIGTTSSQPEDDTSNPSACPN